MLSRLTFSLVEWMFSLYDAEQFLHSKGTKHRNLPTAVLNDLSYPNMWLLKCPCVFLKMSWLDGDSQNHSKTLESLKYLLPIKKLVELDDLISCIPVFILVMCSLQLLFHLLQPSWSAPTFCGLVHHIFLPSFFMSLAEIRICLPVLCK